MSNPNVPNKNTGDTLSATELNSIVDSVETKYDGDEVPLPIAGTELGVVKQGENITIDEDGTINAVEGSYTLPVASDSVLGGVKQGNGVTIEEDGTLNAGDFVPQASPEQEGTILVYTNDAIYGSIGTPETGNITVVLTLAKKGVSVLIIHNSGSAPTFGSAFKKSSASGDYVTGQINYIDTQYIDDTHIRYSISQ